MRSFYSKIKHLLPTPYVKTFSKIISDFNPDVTHFASYSFSKSKFIIDIAVKNSKKVILQPWIYDFFCDQGYAYREGKPCALCVEKGFYQSIRNNCATFNGVNTVKSIHRVISRKRLQSTALKATSFLSSNKFMDDVLLKYSVDKKNIYRFPIPFEIKKNVKNDYLIEEDYFIFYGQAKDFKGINLLVNTFSNLNNIKLKIYPSGFYHPKSKLPHNIEVINDITWNNYVGNIKHILKKELRKLISGTLIMNIVLIISFWLCSASLRTRIHQ